MEAPISERRDRDNTKPHRDMEAPISERRDRDNTKPHRDMEAPISERRDRDNTMPLAFRWVLRLASGAKKSLRR